MEALFPENTILVAVLKLSMSFLAVMHPSLLTGYSCPSVACDCRKRRFETCKMHYFGLGLAESARRGVM
jgi:hypothetical protein